MEVFSAIASIIIGVLMVAWRRQGAREVERFWGPSTNVDRSQRVVEAMYALVGLLIAVFGLAMLIM
jgi:hypothetical protein